MMKKHIAKRFTALLLSLVTLSSFLSFAGCGQRGAANVTLDPKNPTVIELWHYYNGTQKVALDNLITEFNETVGQEKGIVVDAYSQGSIPELTEKVVDAANKKVGAGDVPEIFAAYADTAYTVDKLGLVAPLDKYLTEEELSEYIPGYIEEGRFDKEGALKIFPIAKSTEVFMLNKTDWDKFAAATGASLDSLKTIEGLTATAKRYFEWSNGKAFFGRDAMANYFIIGCKQLGVEIFSVKDGEVSINCDEAVLRKLWDNYYVPYVNGYFAAYGKFRSDDAKTGDIIALVGSTSGAAYFPDKVTVNDTESYPIETYVMAPPVFEGGEKVAVQQGAGMVVSKSTEQKEYASVEFLKWLTDKERNIDFSISTGYMPVKQSANDLSLIEQALKKLEDSAVTRNLTAALPVGVEMTKDHTMYTSKAFEDGTAARAVLEDSMQKQAAADREQVLKLLSEGKSQQEAVARFVTDESFQAWYQSFQSELMQLVK